MSSTDKFSGIGGGYVVDPATGERKQVEAPGQDHPEGNRPRDKDGKPTDAPAPLRSALPAPAAAAPWETPAPEQAADEPDHADSGGHQQ